MLNVKRALFRLAGIAVLYASWPAISSAAKPARVVLPHKIVAGQPVTLAVLDDDGRLLEGVTITFSGAAQATTDETGRAQFTAPSQQGVLFAEARNKEGFARGTAVVIAAPEGPLVTRVTDAPAMIAAASEFSIGGTGFRGEADQNDVTLGGKQAIVLAASPASLIIVPPADLAPGPVEMRIALPAASPIPVNLYLVALEVVPEPARLGPGKRGKLTIHARGVQLPVEIAIINQSPDIIEFPERETKMRLTTSGGAANTAAIEVRGKKEGDFAVEVRLVTSATGLPDTMLAHRELTAAHGIATGEMQKALARLLRHLQEHPQHYLDVRNELEKIMAELPRGELMLHIEAAWRALLKK